jgi:cephalosporin hydroxylase
MGADNMHKFIQQLKDQKMIQQIPSEFAEFMKLVEDLKPLTILEIGVAKGGTSQCFSKVCGNLVSICISDYSPLPNQTYFRRNSHDPATLGKMTRALNGKVVDVLFIDGDHQYEGVKKDYELYSPLVRSGGLIAFHDIVKSKWHESRNIGVPKLWDELKKANSIEICHDKDKKECGIGILIQD